jgi:glucose 1-dehydrogenase
MTRPRRIKSQKSPVVIVTGAAYGIGKAVAIEFAQAGYKLFLVDLDDKNLKKLVTSELKDFPVESYCGDVSRQGDVTNGLKKCIMEYGRVDVLVACAAIIEKAPFKDLTEEMWDRTMAVNLKGVFLWGQAVAQWMMENKKPGRIINLACQRAELATSNFAAYIASKGGVKMLTKAMAVELAPYGINVNAVEPGRTLTEGAGHFFADPERRKKLENLVPMGRLANPEDIASVILFLASDQARYMTGAVIPVDGGYTSCKE